MLQVQQQARTVFPSLSTGTAIARRTDDPWAALESLGTTITIRRGDEIYGEGDAAEYCYKVVDGCVRTVKLVADGGRQIGDILLPGDFFGFEATDEHYFSAQAATATTLRRYPRRAVIARAQGDTRLAHYLHELTTRALLATRRQMVRLCRTTAPGRLASFLLEMAERGTENDDWVYLLMPRSDIADYLGLVIETVSRVLGQFKQDRLICMKDLKRIRLLDRDALEGMQGHV